MNLFQTGTFNLHSGGQTTWKIDCDALTNEDLKTIAMLIAEHVPVFGSVLGIPKGGLRLATFLTEKKTHGPVLIVDDVLTTGASMEAARRKERYSIGAVIFARGECPSWIRPLFQLEMNQKELV